MIEKLNLYQTTKFKCAKTHHNDKWLHCDIIVDQQFNKIRSLNCHELKMRLIQIIQKWMKSLKWQLIGLPDPDRPIQSTIDSLCHFERLSFIFRASRYGFNQSSQTMSNNNISLFSKSFDHLKVFVRLSIVVNLVRGIILSSTDDPTYHLLLGDPLLGSTNLPFATTFIMICLITAGSTRECFQFCESSGRLSSLHDLHAARNDNFQSFREELTPKAFNSFITLIHLIANFFGRFITSGVPMMLFMVNGPLIANPLYWERSDFAIISTLWTISLTFALTFVFCDAAAVTGYYILLSTIYIIRYKSLVQSCYTITQHLSLPYNLQHETRRPSLSIIDDEINNLIKRTTSLSNNMDSMANSIRYFTLYLIFFILAVGDLHIFFGTISPVESKLVASIISQIGFSTLGLLGATTYFSADPMNDVSIYIYELLLSVSLS